VIDLANGIIDDLEQFFEFVKHVINHNPADRPSANAQQTFPYGYVRFMDHIKHLRQSRGLDLEEVRIQVGGFKMMMKLFKSSTGASQSLYLSYILSMQ